MIRLPSIARAQFLGSWSLSFYDFPFPDRVLFLKIFFLFGASRLKDGMSHRF